MIGLAARTAPPVRLWLPALAGICAATGLAAGVNPEYALAAVLGVAFVILVLGDLPSGIAVFTALSFLDILTVGGTAVSFMKVAGLLLVLSWLASAATSRPRKMWALSERHPGMVASIVALVGWSAISAVWAQSSGDALLTVYRDVLVLLLIPIIFSAVRDRDHVRLIMAAFVIGAALSALYGLANPSSASSSTAGRLTGGIGDPNEEASVCVVAIVLAVALLAGPKRKGALKVVAGVGATIAFVGLVGTVSRGGLVAFGSVLVAGVVFGGRWRRAAAVLLVVGVVGVVGYYAFLAPSSARERAISSSSTGRSDLWTIAWRMFTAHPVIGVGAGNFQIASVHYVQRPGLITAAPLIIDVPHVAHNIYLEQLATLGVPGLLAMLGIFVAGIGTALRAAHIFERLGDRELELMCRCTLLGLVAFLSSDFFISNLLSKQLWLVFGLGPALLKLADSARTSAQRELRS